MFEDSAWLKTHTPNQSADLIPVPPSQADGPACDSRLENGDAQNTRGVLIFSGGGRKENEHLPLTLHRLRSHWHGPACVLRSGDEIPSLRYLCLKHNVQYREIPHPKDKEKASRQVPPEIELLESLQWSPFEESVLLDPYGVHCEHIPALFDALAGSSLAFPQCSEPDSDQETILANLKRWRSMLPSAGSANAISEPEEFPSTVCFAVRSTSPWIDQWPSVATTRWRAGLPEPSLTSVIVRWNELDAALLPPEAFPNAGLSHQIGPRRTPSSAPPATALEELELLRSFPVHASVRPDTTLVIALTRDDLGLFHRNWIASGFDEELPVILCLVDCEESDLPPLPHGKPPAIVKLAGSELPVHDDGSYWDQVFLRVPDLVTTSWWIYLDPSMYPVPGAHLYSWQPSQECRLASPGWAFKLSDPLDEALWTAIVAHFACEDTLPQETVSKWRGSSVLRFLKFGPPASLVATQWSREAAALYIESFSRFPLETYLTALTDATAAPTPVIPIRNWGWNS